MLIFDLPTRCNVSAVFRSLFISHESKLFFHRNSYPSIKYFFKPEVQYNEEREKIFFAIRCLRMTQYRIPRKVQQASNICKINACDRALKQLIGSRCLLHTHALVTVARDMYLQDWKLKSVWVEHHCDKEYIMTVTAYSITQLDPRTRKPWTHIRVQMYGFERIRYSVARFVLSFYSLFLSVSRLLLLAFLRLRTTQPKLCK